MYCTNKHNHWFFFFLLSYKLISLIILIQQWKSFIIIYLFIPLPDPIVLLIHHYWATPMSHWHQTLKLPKADVATQKKRKEEDQKNYWLTKKNNTVMLLHVILQTIQRSTAQQYVNTRFIIQKFTGMRCNVILNSSQRCIKILFSVTPRIIVNDEKNANKDTVLLAQVAIKWGRY